MFVIYNKEKQKVPIKIWLKDEKDLEESCLEQALNVVNHPCIFHHLSLMPDTHTGYALPIGGVAALENAIAPYFVGVDIGCGMGVTTTDIPAKIVTKQNLREIVEQIKKVIPVGTGRAHKAEQMWIGFEDYTLKLAEEKDITPYDNFYKWDLKDLPGWFSDRVWELAMRSLGTLGSNNHFLEVQENDEGYICLMIHSGSRNLGYKIADYYHKLAVKLNKEWHSNIPEDNYAFLPAFNQEGKDYIRDMNFALEYAKENRHRIMASFKNVIKNVFTNINFTGEVNIHHNFAALENHFGKNVWVHRKGATQAKKGQIGIIPGSMGTSSYIVRGLGNTESYMSCSHGAGRRMGRAQASRTLTRTDCDDAMKGIVFDGFKKIKSRSKKVKGKILDLGEAPQAYKDIDEVIKNQEDLVEIITKLRPLAVVKG